MATKARKAAARQPVTEPKASAPAGNDAEKAAALAKMALRPSVNAAAVMVSYTKSALGVGESEVGEVISSLSAGIDDVWAGDMKRAEAMLYGQAHALQAIFTSLARRAQAQEYLKQWEAYLRMALKAQNQCRMTLETLATIKNPPVVYARQANINNGGHQQVNNGTVPSGGQTPGTRAVNTTTAPTELLEQQDGERMDPGAAGTTGRTDPQLAPVGAVHRPAIR